MSSQGGDSAEQHRRQQLLRLIYLHLKENGYEKAAKVLKKHICQKETEASVTLYEIYTGWIKTSDGFGDTKQEPGLNRESPPKKSHLSDYAAGVEGDEVKPEKGHIIEKTEEPEFKPIIDDGSVSPCNKPFIPSVVKKSSKSTEGHSDCKDDPDGDQLQTPPGHASSVPPLVELSKPTIPQEETVPLTQDMGVKVISSDSESPEDSEEEEQRPQQQAEGTTPKPTAMKTSSVAGASESKSSADSNDSQREEEAPVQKPGKTPVRKSSKQIPTKGATAAPLKSSQDTTSQALATPKISAAQNKAECSGSESNDNSVSDQEVTQDQKAVKTPKVIPAAPERPRQSVHSKAKDAPEVPAAEKKAESSESESGDDLESEEEAVKESAKPVPDTPHKATTVIVTPGLTKVPSKTEETSENDDQSEREEIPPTQKEVTTSTLTTTQKTPKNGASAAPLKPSQHKSAQAKKSPKGLAVEKSESSESSNDSASEEKADGKPNAAKKTTAVMTPALVKPSTTSGRTTALSKSGEGSESDDESESEDEIPPTQKTKIPKGTPAKISPTRASKTPVKLSHPTPIQAKGAKKADSPESSDDSESEEVATPPQQKAGVTPKAKLVSGPAKTTALKGSTPGKPSYTLAPTTASSKPEESSESDDESESEEEIPPTQVMSTEPTASTHLATPAMVNRGQSSDRDSEESESEDNAPDQKPELTIKPKVCKVIPAKSLSAVTPVRAKTAPTTTSKTTMKTSVSVRRKKSTSTDSEDEIPRKSAPAKRASMVSVKPGHPIPSQVKAAPKAPSKEGKAKEASSDDSESGEDPSAKIAVAASDILPKMKCKSTTQTVQKTPNASKKVAGGSEDLSEKDASLENSALKTPKAKLRAVAPELSSDIKSSTTKGTEDGASILVQEVSAIMDSEPDILGTASSDAAPKNSKDGDVIAEELSQTSLDPKESMKKATERRKRRRKKKKKKKKASVQFEDENISPTGPGQELILPSGGSAISLDQLITMPCKASEEPESSETGVSLKKVGSKSSKSLVSGVNSEGEPEVKTIATEAMPQAKKRRSTDKGDMEPKSKKKKKKKKGADTEANPTELGNNPHSENKLNLEESEKEALTPSDDATAKMGSDDSMESNSTTLILSAKALKKIKKMKKKEKVKVKNTGSKKIKAHKTMSVFTSVAEQLLAITKKKELKKATAVKKPLLVLDPQKRKKFDKDGTIRSEPESEIPAFKKRKKKNKSNREEKTPSKKKQTQDTEDHELQIQGLAESTLVKKKKKKKKNRWKDRGKLIKTPFKGPQGLHLDTPPPLGTSPEPSKAALGKVRKKSRSFRNSE
ncbi:treacle protein-like isoform X5 [Scleropages formosus]|uniref:treacle protein-like isoform X5 n=1 Tax=Scleropages formosus TaxID=113540 RepID=UPI0010FA8547|nr:treacle protein-like isoform X5 [Scleropages formosus]